MNLESKTFHPVEITRTVNSHKVEMTLDVSHFYAIVNGLETCKCEDCEQMVKILKRAMSNPDFN